MADNVEADAGAGGATFATDDVGGVHYPVSKLAFGALDAANLVTSTATNPFPVALSDTDNAVLDAAVALLTTIDGDTGGIITAVQLIDDTIFADDAAFTLTSSKVSMAGAIADSALSDLAAADGDAVPLRTDSEGALWVAAKAGAAQIVDDAAFTPATTSVVMVGAEFDNTATDSVDEGDGGALRMSGNRNLYINIRDNAGNERGLNVDANGKIAVTTLLDATIGGSELQVDVVGSIPAGANAIGKLAANSGVDIGDVDVTSIAAGDNNIGNVDVLTIAAGETHLGEVGSKTVTKTITMTADTAIMAAADVIATTQQLDAAFRKTDGTGVLQSVTVFDPDDNTAFAFDVYFHDTTTSMGTENAAISITDANAAAGILGVVSFATTDAKDLINGRVYHKANIGLPIQAVSGTDDLYVSVINGSGTPTFAGGSIPIRLGILLD